MHIPDRVIVRKIKEYDPHLFIEWNSREQYFELWRRMDWGRRLITPITRSLYNPKCPKEYVQLDERLLKMLYDGDSWRQGGSRKLAKRMDDQWIEETLEADRKRRQLYYDGAKDIWQGANNLFATKYASKNSGKPTWNKHKPENKWVRPDWQHSNAPRVFSRSGANAQRYGFKK